MKPHEKKLFEALRNAQIEQGDMSKLQHHSFKNEYGNNLKRQLTKEEKLQEYIFENQNHQNAVFN